MFNLLKITTATPRKQMIFRLSDVFSLLPVSNCSVSTIIFHPHSPLQAVAEVRAYAFERGIGTGPAGDRKSLVQSHSLPAWHTIISR